MTPESADAQTVRDVFRHVNARDERALLAMVAPGAEIHTRIASVTGEPYRGAEGVERWLSDTQEQFSEFGVEISRIHDHGNGNVVAEGRMELKGAGSDLQWHEDVFYVFGVDAGMVVSLRMFPDAREADRNAAGDV